MSIVVETTPVNEITAVDMQFHPWEARMAESIARRRDALALRIDLSAVLGRLLTLDAHGPWSPQQIGMARACVTEADGLLRALEAEAAYGGRAVQ